MFFWTWSEADTLWLNVGFNLRILVRLSHFHTNFNSENIEAELKEISLDPSGIRLFS